MSSVEDMNHPVGGEGEVNAEYPGAGAGVPAVEGGAANAKAEAAAARQAAMREKMERMREEQALKAEERQLKAEERKLKAEERKEKAEATKLRLEALKQKGLAAKAAREGGAAAVVANKPPPPIPESYGASSVPQQSQSPPPYAPSATAAPMAATVQVQPNQPPPQMQPAYQPVVYQPTYQPAYQPPSATSSPTAAVPQMNVMAASSPGPSPDGSIPAGMHEVYYSNYNQYPQYTLQCVPPVLPKVQHMDKRVFEEPNSLTSVMKDLFDNDPNEISKEKSTDKTHWQRDDDAQNCSRCQKKFSFTVRKHHCRRCQLVVCGKCSSTKHILIESRVEKDAPKRVCDHCAYQRPNQFINEPPVSPYQPNATSSSAPIFVPHGSTSPAAVPFGSRQGPAPRIVFSQDIPPEYSAEHTGQPTYAAPVGTFWPLPVTGFPPGTCSYIVGTDYPIAREVDQVTLAQAHAGQQNQLKAIIEFWQSDDNIREQYGIYQATAIANHSVEPLPIKLQAALNARKEVDLFREKVRALSALPTPCDQASIAAIHAHYTKELVEFASLTAGPAMMVITHYLERVKHYQKVVKLDNAAKEKADLAYRRARSIAAASAPRVDVVYY